MNPPSPDLTPPDPEVKITALLLGELDETEAAKVRAEIASRPELAKLHDQLRHALPLVREALNPKSSLSAAPHGESAQISEPKRTRLLAQLANPIAPFPAKHRRTLPWYVPMSLAACLAGLLTITGMLFSLEVRQSRMHPPLTALETGGRVQVSDVSTFGLTTNLGLPMPPPSAGASGGLSGRGGFGGFGGGAFTSDAVGSSHQIEGLKKVPGNQPEQIKLQVSSRLNEDRKNSNATDSWSFGTSLGRSLERKGKDSPASPRPSTPLPPRRPAEETLRRGITTAPPPASTPQPPTQRGEQITPLGVTPTSAGQSNGERRAAGRRQADPELRFALPKQAASEAIQDLSKPALNLGTVNSIREHLVERHDFADRDELAAVPTDAAKNPGATPTLQSASKARGAAPVSAGAVSAGAPLKPAEPPGAPPTPAPTSAATSHYGFALNAAPGVAPLRESVGDHIMLERSYATTLGDAAIAGELERQQAETILESKPAAQSVAPAIEPQPEVETSEEPVSTFSLNVSDVSFRLAVASLEQGSLPSPSTIRSEEFINAFDYRDPLPVADIPVAFAWQRARYPFAHDRELLRISVKTAAAGRETTRPLNLVLCLDNSGSMERADRVQIMQEAIRVLARQLKPQDRVSVVTFARTARLWLSGLTGSELANLPDRIGQPQPEGGTNLEDALRLAYETALGHYLPNGLNRVVLLTDGAANLGDVSPVSLQSSVERHRRQGIALDCFGIGWEGYNDELLEQLARHGDGRYGFLNRPEQVSTEFVARLAGALQVAASDVKVQVEFNPNRVRRHRQVGYAKHQLSQEQFRDNSVDAAEIGATESGNSIYILNTDSGGAGPIATVRVRYLVPGTEQYNEHAWLVPYDGASSALESAPSNLRLAATASAFSEWLSGSPHAGGVTLDALRQVLQGVPDDYGPDPRPRALEGMILQAKSLTGQ